VFEEQKKIPRWTKQRYKRRPQYTYNSLMTDLRIREPNYKIIVIFSRLYINRYR